MNRPTWKTCGTCSNQYDPADVQGTHPYRHPVDGPLTDSTKESSEKATTDHLPTDPVLRLVLIEKGVIGTEDLRRVEEQLAASGMAVSGATVEQRSTDALGESDRWGEQYAERDVRSMPREQFEPSGICEECGEWVGAFERWQQEVHDKGNPRIVSGHRGCIEAKYGKVYPADPPDKVSQLRPEPKLDSKTAKDLGL